MDKIWRLIEHGGMPPEANMAIDEALLKEHAGGRTGPALRFYQWSPPAVSLGYFQKTGGINQAALDEYGISLVKRVTGGRAVLHWGDLTYSIVARAGEDTPLGVEDSYRHLCRGLLAGLALLGVKASLGSEKAAAPFPASCFAVSTGGDITWQGKKIAGSAQKREGLSLLQHGSILLKPQADLLAEVFSPGGRAQTELLKQKVASLEEILGRPVTPEEVKNTLIKGFEQALGITFERRDISPAT